MILPIYFIFCFLLTSFGQARNGLLDLTFKEDGRYGFTPLSNDVVTSEIVEASDGIYAVLTSVNGRSDAFILKMDLQREFISGFGQNGLYNFPNAIPYDAVLSSDGISSFNL